MRPLRISLRGLRSYRSEVSIDFTGKSLVAFVGPTGAGKSSILEGITYALYNATTWNAGEPKLLIADGLQTMSVVLDFEAGGNVWQIHRACSRTNYPPSVHRLSCLSEPGLPDLDGEDAVNREVQRLVGMSHRAFMAAVILPQGRFQTLLLARPNERIAILEGIFRLAELRDVRTRAEELRNRVNPTLTRLIGRRSGLLEDPAAEAAVRDAELAGATEREKELLALQEQVRRREEAERESRAEVKRLRDPVQRLASLGGGAARSLSGLVQVAAGLDGEIAGAKSSLSKFEQEEQQLAAALVEAAQAGEGFERLSELAASLRGLKAELVRIAAETAAAAVEDRTLIHESEALENESAGIAALDEAWQAASELAGQAEAAVAAHLERRVKVRDRLGAVRGAEKHAEEARAEEAKERAKLPVLQKAADLAAESVKSAEAGLDRARTALRHLERKHAAAHAAQGLKPGDLCPVCGELVQKGFTPPDPGELGPTRDAADSAETELARQRDASTRAQAAAGAAAASTESLQSHRLGREAEASQRLGALLELMPGFDPSQPDDQMLEPVEAEGRALAAEARTRRSAAEEARTAWARADSAMKPRMEALAHGQTRLAGRRAALAAAFAACEREAAGLPSFARPAALEAAAIETPTEEVNRRLTMARRANEEREDLLRKVAAARTALTSIRERRTNLVEEPQRKAAELLARLLPRVNDCLEVLKAPAFREAPEGAGLEQYAAWATDLEACAEYVARQLDERARAVEREVASEAGRLGQRLQEAGFAEAAGVATELTSAQRLIGQLSGARDNALKQVPLAADLDRRVQFGTELSESAQELVRLLADGQFVRHVIERRQRNLLAVASEILGSVTAQRYGFSDDFEIVDRLSGQPRPTRTLSGGETFLASLALALALVEMASRSGRQINALFLDEGFGALDPNALDEALGALERRAGQGRLVAVVSHVKEVADRIESVLEVTKGPSGSRADWRGPREREALAQEDLKVGLIA
ncbi:MAG: SMC family ATPase [Candidatus Dormibacteraeota bacterium]|nr:SMC family ATPase [Candidatus Dormibacteraeota bacterium]